MRDDASTATPAATSIFVVVGATGYGIRTRRWIVCWRFTREEADAVAAICKQQADQAKIAFDISIEHRAAPAPAGTVWSDEPREMFDALYEPEDMRHRVPVEYSVAEVGDAPTAHGARFAALPIPQTGQPFPPSAQAQLDQRRRAMRDTAVRQTFGSDAADAVIYAMDAMTDDRRR